MVYKTGSVIVGLELFRRLRSGQDGRRLYKMKRLAVYQVNLPKPVKCLVDNSDGGTLHVISSAKFRAVTYRDLHVLQVIPRQHVA